MRYVIFSLFSLVLSTSLVSMDQKTKLQCYQHDLDQHENKWSHSASELFFLIDNLNDVTPDSKTEIKHHYIALTKTDRDLWERGKDFALYMPISTNEFMYFSKKNKKRIAIARHQFQTSNDTDANLTIRIHGEGYNKVAKLPFKARESIANIYGESILVHDYSEQSQFSSAKKKIRFIGSLGIMATIIISPLIVAAIEVPIAITLSVSFGGYTYYYLYPETKEQKLIRQGYVWRSLVPEKENS
jgi:hypothetical protein